MQGPRLAAWLGSDLRPVCECGGWAWSELLHTSVIRDNGAATGCSIAPSIQHLYRTPPFHTYRRLQTHFTSLQAETADLAAAEL